MKAATGGNLRQFFNLCQRAKRAAQARLADFELKSGCSA